MPVSANLITHPIALCSYVLSLVFGLLAKRWRAKDQGARDRNLFRLAACLAVLAVVGGLFLAWRETASKTASSQVTQTSSGAQSPNIAGAKDVNVTYGNPPPAADKQKK